MKNEDQKVEAERENYRNFGPFGVYSQDSISARKEEIDAGLLFLLGFVTSSFSRGRSWSPEREVNVKDVGKSDCRRNTDNRSQGQHQADHNTSEIASHNAIDDNKDVLILEGAETHVDTGREEPYQHLQVKVKGRPGGGLMLRDRGNDRNVDLGVSSIPQGVKATRPRCDDTGYGEQHEYCRRYGKYDEDQSFEQLFELAGRYLRASEFDEPDYLEKSKNPYLMDQPIDCQRGLRSSYQAQPYAPRT